jgi:hypothetical protein
MLNIRLGRIVDYAGRNEAIMEIAVKEFFDGGNLELPAEYKDQISQLFNEWLIFDFKLPSGLNIITDYYFKNPDNLSQELLKELKQIIETQKYDYFEVEKMRPGIWMEVWGLFSGKRYRVYELSLSIAMENQRGSFHNRIAKINNKYYFVGSNPLVFPITYTDRSRKFYSTAKKDISLSPKHLLKLLIEKSQTNDRRLSITKHDIKVKRKKLEKKFKKFVNKYGLEISFKKLTESVYHESYESNFADFYKDIMKIGIPEKMIFEQLQFFQDLWNYFPHKKLGGKCPAEKFKEAYG